jgi:hypothetical protein
MTEDTRPGWISQGGEGEDRPGSGREAGRGGSRSFDPSVPNVARIYDFLLRGKDNYAADRDAARQLLAAVPDAALAARDNRGFLARAVRFLAGKAGIRQFLDIGAGLPTRGNVHEIAQAADPHAHVVYCDNDPVVVAHADALLGERLTVAAVNCDLRHPHHLLTLPTVRTLIDFDKPLAILMVAVLHLSKTAKIRGPSSMPTRPGWPQAATLSSPMLQATICPPMPSGRLLRFTSTHPRRAQPALTQRLHGSLMGWIWSRRA